uniref:Uncharacterized protein n=1 Tax=Magnetospirillum gryphiswaldense TaxID=55518 RepID=A4TWQ8_9PROT|nr:hypothetical protein MGR_3730 [Magnetospirillum gryphiswaldense MSR-1]
MDVCLAWTERRRRQRSKGIPLRITPPRDVHNILWLAPNRDADYANAVLPSTTFCPEIIIFTHHIDAIIIAFYGI